MLFDSFVLYDTNFSNGRFGSNWKVLFNLCMGTVRYAMHIELMSLVLRWSVNSRNYFRTSTPTLADGSGDEVTMKLAAEMPDQDLKASPSFAVPLMRL